MRGAWGHPAWGVRRLYGMAHIKYPSQSHRKGLFGVWVVVVVCDICYTLVTWVQVCGTELYVTELDVILTESWGDFGNGKGWFQWNVVPRQRARQRKESPSSFRSVSIHVCVCFDVWGQRGFTIFYWGKFLWQHVRGKQWEIYILRAELKAIKMEYCTDLNTLFTVKHTSYTWHLKPEDIIV